MVIEMERRYKAHQKSKFKIQNKKIIYLNVYHAFKDIYNKKVG